MTISSQVRKAGPFEGNGVTTVFPFAFKVFSSVDLYVVRTNTEADLEEDLVLNADYSVTLNPDQNASPGGSITLPYPLPVGRLLTVTSALPYLQSTDLTNQGGFYPRVVNDSLDRLTIFSQQLKEAVDRSLKLAVSASEDINPTLPTPAANALIGWNSTADGLQNVDSGTMATLVAFGTSAADVFSGDGTTTVFSLSDNPGALNNLDVSVGGVVQRPIIDYTWVLGSALTFTSAPPAGTNNILVRYMQGLPQGYADAGSVFFEDTTVESALLSRPKVVANYAAISGALLGMRVGDQLSLAGHTVAGKGGGIFNVVSSVGLTANNGTCVILGSLAAVRDSLDISVYDFGAIGNGIVDDTNAIQAAINHITNTTFATLWVGGAKNYSKGGGRLRFHRGVFRITKGLLVGPHIEIDGGSTTGFFHPDQGGTNTGAIIVADFVNPNDWIISTANYTSAGAMKGYRDAISGAEIDLGTYNSCHGVTIRNLYAIAVAPCYGGVRLLGAPNSILDNVGMAFTDCGYVITASWGGSYTNLFCLTYLYGFVAAIDVNAAEVSGYFDATSGKTVGAGNRLNFLFADDFNVTVGLPDFSNKKTGILCYYVNSINVTKAASEHFEVSTMFSQTKAISIGTLYSESNTDSLMAVAASNGSVDAIFQQNTIAGANYHFGVGASFTLSDVPALEMSIPAPAFSDIKVNRAKPDEFGWKYNAAISFLGYKEGTIRVSSSGVATNFASATTYTTLEEALNRIAVSKERNWTVIIKDGETVTNDSKKTLTDKTIRFVKEGAGANPTVRFSVATGFIRSLLFKGDCSVIFENVNIDFQPASTPADPLEAGALSFPQTATCHLRAEFKNSAIALQSAWYLFQQSYRSVANLNTTFAGCAITGSGTAKIMGGQSAGDARTIVINSQNNSTCSASVIAAGTNGWENSTVLSSNFV